MYRNSGFTLLELLVAIAVLLILLTTVIPTFNQIRLNNLRAAEVNAFVAAMAYARSEALKRGDRVSLCRTSEYALSLPHCGVGNGWEDGWIIFQDSNRNGQPDMAAHVLGVHEPFQGTGVTLRGNNNVSTRIHYSRTGGMAGTMGTLIRCDQRGNGPQARLIIFPLSGRVRVAEGDYSLDCVL